MKDLEVNGRVLVAPDEVLYIDKRGSNYRLFTSRVTGFGKDYIPVTLWTNEYLPKVISDRVVYVPTWARVVFEKGGDLYASTDGIMMAVSRALPEERWVHITL